MKLIRPVKINPIEIKRIYIFSKTVSAIVLANALVLAMIYVAIYNG